MTSSPTTTHFGFETVDWDEKADKVREVFDSVANRYDLMNNLMSFGVHHIWKRLAIALSHVRPGQTVLDMAGGSGDLTRLLHDRVGKTGTVVLSDINAAMLDVGRAKLINEGRLDAIHYVQANAEILPFPSNHFHAITMGFGLRNVTDKDKALRALYRVCKPGGQLLVLEFSKPRWPGLAPLYDTYSFNILPKIGKWIADDEASYRYLAESIRMHPDEETLRHMIESAGFEDCHYHRFCGGIVALHIAYKY